MITQTCCALLIQLQGSDAGGLVAAAFSLHTSQVITDIAVGEESFDESAMLEVTDADAPQVGCYYRCVYGLRA